LKEGHHVVTRVRRTAVAYAKAPSKTKKRRGAPKKYGGKVRLWSLFDDPSAMMEAKSPVYGEKKLSLRYRSVDLYWRRVGVLVRFVAVDHPTRG